MADLTDPHADVWSPRPSVLQKESVQTLAPRVVDIAEAVGQHRRAVLVSLAGASQRLFGGRGEAVVHVIRHRGGASRRLRETF